MDYNKEKVDNAVRALVSLTLWEEDEYGARAWKSYDWDVMDRLHEKGYIADPKNKAKSVVLTPEGVKVGAKALWSTILGLPLWCVRGADSGCSHLKPTTVGKCVAS